MKSKTKFLWVYTIMLFTVALILILFAGMTQQTYEKELETHETAAVGMQKSVTELSQTNTALKEENAALVNQVEELTAANEELTKEAETTSALLDALELYEDGEKEEAAKLLEGLDLEALSDRQKTIYDKMK